MLVQVEGDEGSVREGLKSRTMVSLTSFTGAKTAN